MSQRSLLTASIPICLLINFSANAADVIYTPSATLDYITYINTLPINGNLIASSEFTTGHDTLINQGSVSGNVINNGAILQLGNGQGVTGSSGIISGSLINSSSGTVNGLFNVIGSTVSGDLVNSGTVLGEALNTGTISGSFINYGNFGNDGAFSKVENIGTVGGSLINAGTARGVILNAGSISGNLVNEGTISSDPGIDSNQRGTLNNAGVVEGNIVNTATGTINGSLLNDSAGAVEGDMANFGRILSDGNLAGDMVNRGSVVGSMVNAGTIGVLSSSTVSGMYNDGTIGKDMTNLGTVNGAMNNNRFVTGNMINAGIVDGDPVSDRQDGGSMSNKGTVNGSMENATGGTLTGEMVNDSGALISGDMINAGTITVDATEVNVGRASGNFRNDGNISGSLINTGTVQGGIANTGSVADRLINTGTVKGDILNAGIVSGGIYNSGTVEGGIQLLDTSLTLEGYEASIAGNITGSDLSVIHVGTAENAADYIASSGNDATTGTISIAQGSRLELSDGVQWTASSSQSDAINNSGTIILNNNSILNGNLTNSGTLSLSDDNSVSATINGSVVNAGAFILNPTPSSAGNTLTINGNYDGQDGSSVSVGSVLGSDNSLSDRLVITGNTSGSSTLYVANENGSGAQTLEGIELVKVEGISSGSFTQGNRIVAGSYDYSLVKGADGWYLTSYYVAPTPNPNPNPTPGAQAVRPEAATYAANLQAANTLFLISLHDREGEKAYAENSGGLWLRQEGGRDKVRMSDSQNKTAANRYVVQLGSTLWKNTVSDKGSFEVGAMGGYASQSSHTQNSLTGYRSKGSVNGYSTGLYATWYQDAEAKSGLYADTWLQYAWFNNEVKGDDLAPETYNSRGFIGSAESGYNLQVGKWTTRTGMQNTVWLQPHTQIIWSGVRANDHTETNGTRVTANGEDNVQLRLGMRAYINGKSALDRTNSREFEPFVEANWIYNTHQYSTALNGDVDTQKGTRNAGELKAGVEARVSDKMSLWTNVAQIIGGKGYSDTQGMIGVRYAFK
ncbi:autotransporter outer membrane beta-barrel domain-containing protein [Pantoea sp. AS142]|uniref:autotransporter outer membrane beta-barrel domain-containing protein n=1 Tax=Pantoea sp. AS142 TaxID=3081292 RepID=UPI0030180347